MEQNNKQIRNHIKKLVAETLPQLKEGYVANWAELCFFLEEEYDKGAREFRIAFQNDNHFIVHPMNQDGNTIDMYLKEKP